MSQETLKNCPICEKAEFVPFLTCTDYLLTKEKFGIQTCRNCGFKFTNPRPTENTLGMYYQSSAYISHNDQEGGIINRVYRLVRNYTLKQKLKLINSLHPEKGAVLDIGCGTGLFLETCQKSGWKIAGVEPDPKAREATSQRLRIPVPESIKQLKPEQFDLITMWHVLEHVPNLKETITEIHDRLKKGGTLLLALPNADSQDANKYKEYWAAYDIPRHLSHFTPKTIEQLVSQQGFQLKKTYPMYFDAYYIAMLSTKYRDGKTNWLESIIQGFTSNRAASKSGNYSSLIYVFEKLD